MTREPKYLIRDLQGCICSTSELSPMQKINVRIGILHYFSSLVDEDWNQSDMYKELERIVNHWFSQNTYLEFV